MGRTHGDHVLYLLDFERPETEEIQVVDKTIRSEVFGQGRMTAKTIRVGLYARVSTLDQQTLPTGRAMASLLAVFAEFEREILQERVRARLEHFRN